MHEVGIPRISISIDFPTAEEHDEFRGVPGAFDGAVRGIRNCLDAGVEVQINTHHHQAQRALPAGAARARRPTSAPSRFHPFMLVPTGRGKELEEQELPPEEYERALDWMYDAQQKTDLFFKPTDVPHYYRIMRQRAKEEGRSSRCTRTPRRHEHAQPRLPRRHRLLLHQPRRRGAALRLLRHGRRRRGKQTFSEIWRDSPLFNELRDFDGLKGKCGVCEYKTVCGGCRARAYEVTGDYLAEEPYCVYVPRAGAPRRAPDPDGESRRSAEVAHRAAAPDRSDSKSALQSSTGSASSDGRPCLR